MITAIRRLCLSIISFLLFSQSNAQDLRSFNQNSSRSNRGLSISLSPSYSASLNNSEDSLLFRGSGGGFRVGADYFLGKAGIGFSSGFGSSAADNSAINNFLKNSSVPPDQLLITKSNQQNMYLLLGPSVRFGNAVQLYAHAKGGLFINNGGLVSIQQKGAVRAAYRNESTGKSIYPGFQTGLSFQYKGKSDVWSFGIGADYMSTKSEVTNYDARRGGGIEGLKLSRSINDIVAGVTVRYNIFSPRDHSSGQSTGKRVLPTVNKREATKTKESTDELASVKTYQPGRPVFGNFTSEEKNEANCGPVTQRITNADGTTEEMTFSCPDDAAKYNNQMKIDGGMPNRISMNVSTPKQTQGATFGEKSYAVPHVFEQKGIISGKLTWPTAGQAMGIVTNKTVGPGRSGSVTMNSQTSSTRQTQQSSFGTMVRLSAREAGSGQATGKRSREKGSGLATGRRQYEPIFIENNNDVCNPCMAEAKLSSVKDNPLYKDNGMAGTNPLNESNKRTAGGDDDCDGIAGIDVFLIDQNSKTIISKTKTERCGDFFFANVPDGNYKVKVSGSFTGKKGYDVYLKSKTDLMGDVSQSGDGVQLLINSGKDNEGMAQKAGISTSRSNIRTKSISIINADLDGDGEFESLKATGTFSDGSSNDITNDVSSKKVNKIDAFTIKQGVMKVNATAGSATSVYITGITIAAGDLDGDGRADVAINGSNSNIKNMRASATLSDGTTMDVTDALFVNTSHSNLIQYSIVVGDLDGDGFADAARITKSRSNIQNNRTVADLDDDGPAEAIVKTKTKSNQSNDRFAGNSSDDEIWSPRSNIKILNVAAGDVDGDGMAEMILGGALPGGAVISSARPGSPIKGISVKGGRNPGGTIGAMDRTTNESGQFEFPDLEPGDYTFTVEQKIVIEDETLVTVGNKSGVQDHNSSRSNKSSNTLTNDPNDDYNGSENKSKVQDHNSSRSNKSSSIVADDPDNNDVAGKKRDVKLTASQNNQSLRTIGPDMEPDVDWITSKGAMMNTQTMKARNNNTVRSNRIDNALIENFDNNSSNNTPVKWMAPESMKAAINTSHSNIKNLRTSLNELEKQLTADQTNAKATINTSRSNIKNQRAAMDDLEETLEMLETKDKNEAMNELDQKMAVMNMQFLSLQESLVKLGRQYTTISNVLKTRHDIAMNSIRNMK